jgi:malate synthase
MNKHKFLTEIATEMEVRRRGLLEERDRLARADARVLEIDELVADIDVELVAMKAKVEAALPAGKKDK